MTDKLTLSEVNEIFGQFFEENLNPDYIIEDLSKRVRDLERENLDLKQQLADAERKLELFNWAADNDVHFEHFVDGYDCSMTTFTPNFDRPVAVIVEGFISEFGETPHEALTALRESVKNLINQESTENR